MTHVTVEPVAAADKLALWRELQDYIAEMKEFAPWVKPEPDGSYAYDDFDKYWSEPGYLPFWLMEDGERIGFALLRPGAKGVTDMAEFYVAEKYRGRKGCVSAGEAAAKLLLAMFPGKWTISMLVTNEKAMKFWPRVAEGFDCIERRVLSVTVA